MSNLNFEQWMQKVDEYLSAKVGCTSGDLMDFCYMDAYDDGASPAQAARQAIKAEREG
jgi:hypothetical protein